MAAHRPFLARVAELQALGQRLDAAASGTGGGVLFVGEAGIGKTRLLEAAAELGRERGFGVGWGRAFEAGNAPAFWPWREVERALAAQPIADTAGVPSLFETHARAHEAAATWERASLFEAMLVLLGRVASARPLLLLLDDLHAADISSLALLEHLLRRLGETRILLVGAHRRPEAEGDPEQAALFVRLARLAHVICPSRLDRDSVALLVASELDTPSSETIRMIHEASDGNPLYVQELARLAASRAGGQAGPAGLQAILRERLAPLAPATVMLLQAAALVGREFSVTVAAGAAGVLAEALDEAMTEVEDARLLAQVGPGRYRFVHGIWPEALAEAMPASARERLHVRIAQALERRHQGDPDAPLATIAHHYLAGGIGVAGEACRSAEAAAAQAEARLAFEEASRLYEAALAAAASSAPADVEARLRIGLRLIAARRRAGQAEAAWSACQTVAQWARDIGRHDLLAEAALTWGAEFSAGVVDPRHVTLLEEALAHLPVADNELRARVLARLAAAQQPARDPAGPVALAREAVAMVGRVASAPARLPVLNAAAAAMLCYVPPDERLSLDDEVTALATAAQDWPAVFQSQVRLAFNHVERGDVAASARAVAAICALADRFPQPRLRWPALLLSAMQPLFSGRFAQAESLEQAVATFLQTAPDAEAERALWNRKLIRLATRTDWDGLAGVLEQGLLRAGADALVVEVLAGWRCAQLEDSAGARATLLRLPRYDVEAILRDPSLGAALAEVIVAAGDRELATLAQGQLASHRGHAVMVTLVGYAMWDLADRALLRLATLLERWDAADEHARCGRDLAERLGARPFAARLSLDFAQSLRARGDRGDTASRLGEQALAEAEALGMPGLRVAAQAFLAGQAPSAQPQPSEAPATTVREGEDWVFLGAGETCRLRDGRGPQILARLLASPGHDVHVLDLVVAEMAAVDVGDAGEILDAPARRAYVQRLSELRDELALAESWHDRGRVEALGEEARKLEQALAEAVGLGGRARRAGSAAERARVNVQRRLADALRRIERAAPRLGRHLASTIRTGMFCCYRPEQPHAPR